MITPNIIYYARLSLERNGSKTPKYVITATAGNYAPMEKLKGRDGRVSMFLVPKTSYKSSAPQMRLQAKDSLNFTGLKDYFMDGKMSGYAYGYAPTVRTYTVKVKEKPNPLYGYENDGFLFIIHQDETATSEAEKIIPSEIELIVLEGAKVLIPSYCKQLCIGGFDEILNYLRKQSNVL